jgi:hypothetical protein
MAKPEPAIDWQIAENDAEWDALRSQRTPDASPNGKASPHPARLRRSALFLLLMVVSAGV